jgi:energy-coupling factor transporter ATP-binding protein EcfA2
VQVQKGLIDMESMFAILVTVPKVRDIPGAVPLRVTEAQVKFDSVAFGYSPANFVVSDVSFTVPGGQTFALVGATGSGKVRPQNIFKHGLRHQSAPAVFFCCLELSLCKICRTVSPLRGPTVVHSSKLPYSMKQFSQ